ncbi:MAG: sterol desaturase family protein [Okeania sp. SIO2C9]|uniref:sterol desaturase family protein n=1 Tax=Okeania sp. SIO2C9 TaxID=2607791 RepID=UPI0013C0ED8F|nr:sterol desaturase family protein [Okeania sp. SIO2C9]NEQ71735.1 sterol desaturase family protein [Okeania sp. SIO2C9]
MIVFITFWVLTILTLTRQDVWKTNWQDWLLDMTGLLFQGLVIPVLQITVVYQGYKFLLPHWENSINITSVPAFILSFVLIDYLYYWNHRLLHSSWFWHLHKVHHTVTQRNVFGTSRNTLWTSFFIIYLWVHSLFIYLLIDPSWYILGVSLTSALDLWRHSEIEPKSNNFLARFLSPWLILPQDHAWHHSNNPQIGNYGANLKIWDVIHRTNFTSDKPPQNLGITTQLTLKQKLFFPFK